MKSIVIYSTTRSLAVSLLLSSIAVFSAQSAFGDSPDSPSTPETASATPAGPELTEKILRLIDSTQENVLLEFLNCETPDGLEMVRGVAATRAAALVEARPFDSLREVAEVRGIGVATFFKIVKHLETLDGGGIVDLDTLESEVLLCK